MEFFIFREPIAMDERILSRYRRDNRVHLFREKLLLHEKVLFLEPSFIPKPVSAYLKGYDVS